MGLLFAAGLIIVMGADNIATASVGGLLIIISIGGQILQ